MSRLGYSCGEHLRNYFKKTLPRGISMRLSASTGRDRIKVQFGAPLPTSVTVNRSPHIYHLFALKDNLEPMADPPRYGNQINQAKSFSRAVWQMTTTAGCLSFLSMEIA